jgi:PEP-CTERM motif
MPASRRHLSLFLAVLATPAWASLRLTGIIDGNPNNDPFDSGSQLYKAVEIFAAAPVSATELQKYAIRRFDEATTGPAFTSVVQLNPDNVPGMQMQAGDFGYVVINTPAFESTYYATGGTGDDWANNSGQDTQPPYPIILIDGSIATTFDGNEVWQLLYYPNGFTSPAGLQVIDTFGILGDTGAQNQTSWSWDYGMSYAYRNNGTGPSGASFNINDWTFGEPGMFQRDDQDPQSGLTIAEHASIVPFGTFVVPEPGTLGLFALGAALLLRRRR